MHCFSHNLSPGNDVNLMSASDNIIARSEIFSKQKIKTDPVDVQI